MELIRELIASYLRSKQFEALLAERLTVEEIV